MAETILELKLRGVDTARKRMDDLSESIEIQKKKQRELRKEIKELEKELDGEGTATKETMEALADKNLQLEASRKQTREYKKELTQTIRVEKAQQGTLEANRATLARLKTEYAKINTETEEGARTAAIYEEHIGKLNKKVKEQEKSIGDTSRNVGNYEEAIKDALSSMIPFGNQLTEVAQSGKGVKGTLSALSAGIKGATRSAIAFISTGIGAAIAGLAAVGLATKAWFDYNNEIRETNQLLAGITDQTGETLDGIRRQTKAIEDALGISAEESAKAAKVLVEQFGISYEEALDKLKTGILATNGANDELLQSIGEYSTFFSQAGFSVDEFTGIINAGFDLGIYTDKLPDALKEADLRLREQTKSTRDALVNAFDEEFTDNLFAQIDSGAINTAEALQEIRRQAEETAIGEQALAQVTADVFAGAGEDAGGALKVFNALTVGISGSANELDEYGQQLSAEIDRATERAEEMDAAFKSENFIAFQEGLREIGHFIKINFIQAIGFLTDGLRPIGEAFGRIAKAFGLTTNGSKALSEAFQFLTKVALLPLRGLMKAIELGIKGVAVVVETARKAFDKLSSAASSLSKPIKSIASALGMQSKETDKATKTTSELIKKLKEHATSQAEANKQTEAAAVVLTEAKDRAKEYVKELQDIVREQQRQPLLMSAEDIFSERSAEEVTENLRHIANQIKDNANITQVSVNGMLLSVEEYAQLAQDRLNDIEKAEEDARRASEKRSEERRKQRLEEAEEEAERLLELEEEQRLANQKRIDDNIQAVRDEYDGRIKAIQDGLAMEMLVKETAHLDDLRTFIGTEEQKLALQKQFHLDNLELQKQALQDQMAVIEKTLAEGDLLAMLETGILDESTQALAELRNAIAGINLEIANAGKDEDGEPQTLAERLGITDEQIYKATFALDTLQESFAIAQQAMSVAETKRLQQVDEQVQRGVITEEQAEAKKERISKKAARQQQAVSVMQAVINVAQGITKTLATVPAPFAQILAATIAAQGAVQVATIKAQKFAKGGILNGPSHAQGGIPMFSKGGAFYGEAEGGEAVLTKGVMANPALARMASAINVAGGGVPFFANGGVLDPIQSATPTDRAVDLISAGLKSRQPVLVVEQLRERENSVDVIESLRTIG